MYYFTTITAGATMDIQILKDLFKYYGEAAKILKRDNEYAYEVLESRERLVPSQVGKDGTLQEWMEDYGQLEDKHRHFSHMYGLFPGNVLSKTNTPEFIEPIKAVLEQRGDGGTGFSRAWKMALWARLSDGERANSIYKSYLQEQCYLSLFAKCNTPLQVDGTLGVTAAISEMLVQSHEDGIELLPALPNEWDSGRFKGVCTRGAFELDMIWKNNAIKSVEVLSKAGKNCKIRTNKKPRIFTDGKQIQIKENNGFIEFPTEKGKIYILEY